MRKVTKIGLISLAVVAALIAAGTVGAAIRDNNALKAALAAQKTATVAKPPTRAELLRLVNAERAKYHVAPLKESPILDKSAQWKADDEVKYGYFGHVKPGTSGNDGLNYLESIGSPCGDGNISENLHWANKRILTAKETVDGWIASPPHHRAMINGKYTLTGFGIAGNQVVEHFCSPERFTTPTTTQDTSN